LIKIFQLNAQMLSLKAKIYYFQLVDKEHKEDT